MGLTEEVRRTPGMGAVKVDVGIAVSLAMFHANVEDAFLSLVTTTREMETG